MSIDFSYFAADATLLQGSAGISRNSAAQAAAADGGRGSQE
jgi:hypothetical protein